MTYHIEEEGRKIVSGDEYKVRETVEELLENHLGFFVSLQENTDDEEFEIYMHTDNYEDLSEDQLETLANLEITESNSIPQIEKLLNIKIIG